MSKSLIRRVLMKLDKNYLPYEHFKNLKLFEKLNIMEGVTVERFPTSKGLYLYSMLEKGTMVIEHYHNSFEYIYLKKGRVVINDKTTLSEGDSISFKPFEVHKVKVLETSEIYVQLIKNEEETKKTK